MKNFLLLLLLSFFIFPYSILASSLSQEQSNILIKRRLSDWPEWRLPGPFKHIALEKDIVYPSWFNGTWIVKSTDLKNNEKESLRYEAKFKLNSLNEVIGDRAFNALSVGKAVLGDQLLRVQDDPKSPNRQVATFDKQIFLESKVIGRHQFFEDESSFFVDELVLQIFHNFDISRIKRVETLSKFQLCNDSISDFEKLSQQIICGEQWQAVYPGPGESLGSKPTQTSHYYLTFRRSH